MTTRMNQKANLRRPKPMVFNGTLHIKKYLDSGRPGAFGKIGGTEGKAITLRKSRLTKYLHFNRYLRFRKSLYFKSGVFPESSGQFEEFLSEYTQVALPNMDGLCCWRGVGDYSARDAFAPKCLLMDWDCLSFEPLLSEHSWVGSLTGMRVLVVSSFQHTIPAQARKISEVWPTSPHLQVLKYLDLMPCPMYAHLAEPIDASWSEALKRMKLGMESFDFDVCLIAAGAWSLPLAAHAKSLGKIGIHLGGALQLLFGITGNRWEKYGALEGIKNEHWCFPHEADTPDSFDGTEDAAYWNKKD